MDSFAHISNSSTPNNKINICYKKFFNEAQMRTSWLKQWTMAWTIDDEKQHKVYTLILTFPLQNLVFVSQSYHNKKFCEEDCLKQFYEYFSIVPQSGLILQEGELKAQDDVIENTILTTTQEKVIIPSVNPVVEERYLSEDRFSDPSLVGVAYRLSPFTWDPATVLIIEIISYHYIRHGINQLYNFQVHV